MATMKRRVIYLSDEMWATVKRQAEKRELSVSDWLRGLVTEEAFERQETDRRPGIAPVRAVLDTVLADRSVGRVFPEFRPVPKVTHRVSSKVKR